MENLLQSYQDIANNTSMVVKNFNIQLIINKIKQHKTPIGIAIALMIARNIYGQIFLPPKKLRHIPHYNFFTFFRRILQGVPHGPIQRELVVPLYQHKKKGEIYLRKGFLGWQVTIANPEDSKVFFLKTDIFRKADMPQQEGTFLSEYLGKDNLVFLSNKNEWKRQRMLVSPAFKKSMPVRLFADYTYRTFDIIDNTKESTVEVKSLMERFTLDIIGKAGFDFEFNSLKEGEQNEWVDTYHGLKKGSEDPLFFLFPFLETKFLWLFPRRKQVKGLIAKFYSMLDKVIEHKRQVLKNQKSSIEEAEKDLLTLMLEDESSEGKGLSDSELRSNINIFFIAGHDTTANTLAAVIYYLAKYQDIQKRAREEAISVLGDEPVNSFPTLEQTKKFVYINQIMKETLRISGPVQQVTPRITTQDTELSGTFIPKNTTVSANLYDIHHNPNVWKNPNTFNPDRFAPGGEAENMERDGLSWVPFAS
ncbi:unnamed protein product [Cunninghamella blakesleeana]